MLQTIIFENTWLVRVETLAKLTWAIKGSLRIPALGCAKTPKTTMK